MLLTSRKLLQKKLLDVEADLRGTLRNSGLKVGVVSTREFAPRIRELVEGLPRLAAIVEPMLATAGGTTTHGRGTKCSTPRTSSGRRGSSPTRTTKGAPG
jgi:hypothetical protein